MNHFSHHKPTLVSDIVFADAWVKQDLLDYAQGKATGNILLHGEYGTGKTTIAQAIVCERYVEPDVQNNIFNFAFYNAKRDADKITEVKMLSALNIQMFDGVDAPTIIVDEVDRLSERQQDELVGFIDSAHTRWNGMVIMTTNHLNKVDGALSSRSMPYHIKGLLPHQAFTTANNILLTEGFDVPQKWLLEQLETAVAVDSDRADWRRYGQVLDRIIRSNQAPKPKPKPKLRVVK